MKKFVFLFLAIFAFPFAANACKPCGSDRIGYSSRNSDFVFIGSLQEPLKQRYPDITDFKKVPKINYTYTVNIKRVLKGSWPKDEIIVADGTSPGNMCTGTAMFIPDYSKDYIFFPNSWFTQNDEARKTNTVGLHEYCGVGAVELMHGKWIRVEKGFNSDIQLQTYDLISVDEYIKTYLSKN